jgi:hypothetical protein
MQHVWVREELRIWFWWGNVRERNHLEQLGVVGMLTLKRFMELGLDSSVSG